jgi:hypothetical protein
MSAIGFVVLLMVQAMAFYAPTPEAPKSPPPHLLAPATKAAPVLAPQLRDEAQEQKKSEDRAYLGGTKSMTVIPSPPLVPPEQSSQGRVYLPATKAGILGPLKVSKPAPSPPQQGTPPPGR